MFQVTKCAVCGEEPDDIMIACNGKLAMLMACCRKHSSAECAQATVDQTVDVIRIACEVLKVDPKTLK
jgi:hypothetical protein